MVASTLALVMVSLYELHYIVYYYYTASLYAVPYLKETVEFLYTFKGLHERGGALVICTHTSLF